MKNLTYNYCLQWAKKHDAILYNDLVKYGERGMNMAEVSAYIRAMKKV